MRKIAVILTPDDFIQILRSLKWQQKTLVKKAESLLEDTSIEFTYEELFQFFHSLNNYLEAMAETASHVAVDGHTERYNDLLSRLRGARLTQGKIQEAMKNPTSD